MAVGATGALLSALGPLWCGAIGVSLRSGPDLCLRVVRLDWGGGGGWVGPWPVGGWVSLVLGNLAQRAYSPPGGGGGVWVGGWVGRGWVGPDSRTGALG